MRKYLLPLLVASFGLALFWGWTARATADNDRKFIAVLTGAGEVPPRVTPATGEAVIKIERDGTIRFKLEVEDITNVFAAHIHLGAPGVNGPVIIGLYSGFVASGPIEGTISEGKFRAPQSLIDAIVAGNTYVNVHTLDGVAPPNQGPGDFPGGEIRGQLLPDNDDDDDDDD